MPVLKILIVRLLATLGLLLQFMQHISHYFKTKWAAVAGVFLIVGGGYAVYTLWGETGLTLLFGILLVLTLLLAGVNTAAQKVEQKKEALQKEIDQKKPQ